MWAPSVGKCFADMFGHAPNGTSNPMVGSLEGVQWSR